MSVSAADLGWVAGLLEGKGSFGMNLDRPCLLLASSDEDVVQTLASIWRTKIRGPQLRDGSKKKVWVASVHGGEAVGWMQTIYTLVGVRRQRRIRELLDKWKNPCRAREHKRTHRRT